MAESNSRVRRLSLTSEYPVQRWFGTEILDHSPESVRMGFMKSGRAPVLMSHDQRAVIGVIDKFALDSKAKRTYMDARFGRGQAADDALRDVDDKILNNTSAGYRVHEMVLEKSTDTEDTYRITDWEPLEGSLVGIPADPTVGADRSHEPIDDPPEKTTTRAEPEARISRASSFPAPAGTSLETSMDPKETAAAGATAEETANDPRVELVRAEQQQVSGAEREKRRIKSLQNLARSNSIDDNQVEAWVTRGTSLEDATEELLTILEQRGKFNPQPRSKLGLTQKEVRQFSLVRAVMAAEGGDWTHAGFELECTKELAKRENKVMSRNSFLVPYDIMERSIQVPAAWIGNRAMTPTQMAMRDMTVGAAANGGYLVETSNLGFIEMLRNRSVAYRMGARRLPGLSGNVTIPRQSGAATAVWLANEAATITESQQTLQQVSLSPKTVGAYTEVSRQLMLQSQPAAEGLVTADLAAVAALAVDVGVINGSGASGQPTGIINTSGVGSVTGTTLGFAGAIEFQTDVAGANVMPVQGGYVTRPDIAGLMIQRVKYTNTASPIWEGNVWDGQIQGFPAMSSLQIPSATMLFGDWFQVLVGEWGVLEITVNPYANFQGLLVGIRAVVTVDVALRYAGAFSIASSIT